MLIVFIKLFSERPFLCLVILSPLGLIIALDGLDSLLD